MKSFSIMIVAACMSIGLVGCVGATAPPISAGTIAAAPVSSNPLVDQIILQGHRDLTLAAIAYDSAAKTATAGVVSGMIRGSALDTLQSLNRDATKLLVTGYDASNAAEKASAALSIRSIVSRIARLSP